MLGHLFTTWGGKKDALTEYRPLVEGLKLLNWFSKNRGPSSMRNPANVAGGTAFQTPGSSRPLDVRASQSPWPVPTF
jgi:hypothetical protein